MNLNSIIQHSRELREIGRGQQVRDILLGLSDYEGTAFELAQIGIEMNYIGLFRHAEKMIERAVATEKFPVSIYISQIPNFAFRNTRSENFMTLTHFSGRRE
jgi:hypothetical protein